MRRWQFVPFLFAGMAGVLVLIDVFEQGQLGLGTSIGAVAGELIRWTIVLTAFALVAGILNVIVQHVRRLLRLQPNWPYSLALLIGLVVALGTALATQFASLGANPLESQLMIDLFRYVYTPLSASLLALLAFFGLTAALRALGSGRREAVVLVLVAAVMLVLQLPLASAVPAVGLTATWLQDYPVLAGARALILGGAIGALVASLRILMGVDRPYLDH